MHSTPDTRACADTVRSGLQVLQFDSQLGKLPVGCLLAAAFMTYLAAEPEDARESALAEWHRIVGWTAGSFNFVRFLSTENETLTWKSEGQPGSCACAAHWLCRQQLHMLSIALHAVGGTWMCASR